MEAGVMHGGSKGEKFSDCSNGLRISSRKRQPATDKRPPDCRDTNQDCSVFIRTLCRYLSLATPTLYCGGVDAVPLGGIVCAWDWLWLCLDVMARLGRSTGRTLLIL